ncbi:MAG TPA: hypothetical protein EYN67_14485 [Flavobacteriales bacterium]|nr:hypothetical protein [Flavobacteriales bacterium]
MAFCINPQTNEIVTFGGNVTDPMQACQANGYQWVDKEPETKSVNINDLFDTVTDDNNDLDEVSGKIDKVGTFKVNNLRDKDSVATNKVMGGECILPEGAEWDHVCHPDHDEYKAAMAQEKGPDTTFNLGDFTKKDTYQTKIESVIPKSVTSTLKGEDSPVSDFLWGSAKDATKGGMSALGDRAARWLGLTEGDYDDVDSTSLIPTDGIPGAPQDEQQVARKGYIEGGELPAGALPSVESIAPVGPQTSPYVDDSQFVDTMDGQLANQGYMGPQLDQQGQQVSALEGAPQYDIQGLPTLHQEGGQFIDHKPEDVIAGAQGLVDQTAGEASQGDFRALTGQAPQQQQLDNELSLGDAFGNAVFGKKAYGAEPGMEGSSPLEGVEGAVLEIVSDTNKAVQNIEQILADTGLINDPQVVEAVNNFVQEVDKLAEEQPTEEATDDDLDTLMMQAEFDAEMLDEEYDSRVQRLPDRWAKKDKFKSAMDSITDFLGDMLTKFTEITGITSKDLMRALIMYAGSRLVGYNGADSLQFAYSDFEKNVSRRFEDNKESREFLANSENLNSELDKLGAQKAEIEATGGDTSGVDRRIASIQEESNSLAGGDATTAAKDYALFEAKKADLDKRRAAEEATVSSLPPEEQEAALEEVTTKYDLEEGVLAKALTDAPDYKSKDRAQTHKNALLMNAAREKAVSKRLEATQEAADAATRSKGDSEYFLKLTDGLYTGPLGDMYASWNRVMAVFGFNIDENAKGEVAKKVIQNFVQHRMSFTKGSITEKEMAIFKAASPGLSTSEAGLKLLLGGMIYNDQYTIDVNRHMNTFVDDYVTENNGMYPTTQRVNLEIDKYKEENPFELPFTNEEIRQAENARQFDFKRGMSSEEQDDQILNAADNKKSLDVHQMKAAIRANKRRQEK